MSGAGLVDHVAHVEHLKVPRRDVVDRPDTIAPIQVVQIDTEFLIDFGKVP